MPDLLPAMACTQSLYLIYITQNTLKPFFGLHSWNLNCLKLQMAAQVNYSVILCVMLAFFDWFFCGHVTALMYVRYVLWRFGLHPVLASFDGVLSQLFSHLRRAGYVVPT